MASISLLYSISSFFSGDKCIDCDVHAMCNNGYCKCRTGFRGSGLKGDCKPGIVCIVCVRPCTLQGSIFGRFMSQPHWEEHDTQAPKTAGNRALPVKEFPRSVKNGRQNVVKV